MHTAPAVKDIMQETIFSVRPDASVYEALDLLIAKKLSGIPVLDNDHLVGFLTEKDCLRLQATAHMYNMTGRKVRDIMSSINETLHPSNNLLSAAQVFLACNFAALPVIENGELVGSITRKSIIHALQQWHHDRGVDFVQEKKAHAMEDNPNSIEHMQNLAGKSSREQLASVLRNRS